MENTGRLKSLKIVRMEESVSERN